MRRNCIVLALSLLLISTSSSFAQDSESTESLSVQGIWMVSLGDLEITMAVNQSGDSLFGQAKFEGEEPWNGVIAGALSERAVHIALAALQGNVLVSTQMSGTVQGDSIDGSYVTSDSNSLAAKGEFTAARISPDPADYSPAQVAAAPEVAPAPAEQEVQPEIEPEPEPEPAVQPAVPAKSRFNDVRDLAKGIDPNILPRTAPL